MTENAGAVAAAREASSAENKTIAVFTKNTTNPAYAAFRLAVDQVARAGGARTVHYVPRQPDNVAEQTAFVAQAIAAKPDIVIFIPVDDVAMVEPVTRLNAAGIPIVLASNPLPGRFVTFVGADDDDIGYRQAMYLFAKLGGRGRIVVLEGTPAAPTSRARLAGYRRALAATPGIAVLASAAGNFQQADGRRVMAQFLRDHAQIDAVLSANDSMALGALEALDAAGRRTTVIGINGILAAVQEIAAGRLLASVDFNMFKIGCTCARAALRCLAGEPLPERIILPTEVIDQSNYQAWLTPVEQRVCPEWADVLK
jgi:ribose transport system substrate-binding protein